MNNGKHSSESAELASLLRKNNKLLIEQIEHLVSMASAFEAVLAFLPACQRIEKPEKEAVLKLLHAYRDLGRKNRRDANRRLKKAGIV